MRILIVGASGTIGTAVVAELEERHDVVSAGRTSGAVRLDITVRESIRSAFEQFGSVDAVVSAAGSVKFAPFGEMSHDDYTLDDKIAAVRRQIANGEARIVFDPELESVNIVPVR